MLRSALITGVTGHLGSHFVINQVGIRIDHAYVLVRGATHEARLGKLVEALEQANNSYVRRRPLADIMKRVTVIEGDIRAPLAGVSAEDLVAMRERRLDELWHFAASLSFEDRKAKYIEETNLAGTKHVLEFAMSAGVPQLFHCSTAYTCGTRAGVIESELHPIDGPFSNEYERSKCAAEHYLVDNCDRAGIKLAILRPSVVIGNSETSRPGGATTGLYGLIRELHQVQHLLQKSATPIRLSVLESGVIDFIPVDRLMRQIDRLLKSGTREGIFHLVSPDGLNNAEICVLVTRALGIEPCIEFGGVIDGEPTPLEKLLEGRMDFYKSYFRAARRFAQSFPGDPGVTHDQMRRFVDEGVRALKRVDVASIMNFGLFHASDGARLNVYSTGPQDGPVALLCNAAGMPVEFVRPVVQRLAKTCRVITWETRGLPSFYDGAECLDFRMERQVRDGLEVLEHFGVTSATLLGWCAGTRIAMDIASAWSGTTTGLVLMNGGYPIDPPELTALTINLATTMPRVASDRQYADEFYRVLMGGPAASTSLASDGDVASINDLIETAYESNADNIHLASLPFESAENLFIYANLLKPYVDTPQDLSNLPDVQTLILTCDGDLTAHPKSSTRFAAEVLVKAQCVSLPFGDHFSLYWDEKYIDIVEEFVLGRRPADADYEAATR
ncbi:SDR family oxidoreductase [Mycobacterium avium]|nr:SDR family oxidoreductase [Mycobacterium avium]